MGALLNFKAPGAAQASALHAVPASVLDGAMVARLAQLNAAVRRLRGMGYRVVEQTVSAADDGRPCVQIDQGNEQAIQPLLAVAGGPMWRQSTEGRWGRVVLEGVVVTWQCARQGETQR